MIKTIVCKDKEDLGYQAAALGAEKILETIRTNGHANIILATGASQFEMIKNLVTADIPWEKVTMFHLDEYIDLPETHPASFRKYLKERFIDKVSGLHQYFLIDGNGDITKTLAELGDRIRQHPIDVCFAGIGENGHLAFNDPPADFSVDDAYIVVDLDEKCRRQQMGEGWFENLEAVPKQAISMTISQIMKSRAVILSVPDARKAEAVANTLEQPVSPDFPASVLQNHPGTVLYLDKDSASMVNSETR